MPRMGVRPALAGMVAWVTLSVFQFGFGISELNAIALQFTCREGDRCLRLSDNAFALVTTMFTVGGALSSLLCGSIARRLHMGRRNALQVSAGFSLVGSLLLWASSSLTLLSSARLLQGIGAGIGVVQVPMYLQEISPPSLSGEIGILNQVAVVTGIFCAQAAGTMVMSSQGAWWHVPEVSALVALLQLVLGAVWAYESPGWLEGEGAQVAARPGVPTAATIRKQLWGHATYEALQPPAAHTEPTPNAQPWQSSPAFRQGMWIVALTQMAQQFSGVNAILYYSTGILSKLMPALANSVGLLITVVNGLLTFPPIALISEDRLGRKALLVGSAGGMGAFCLLLAYCLWQALPLGSAVAILCVIACFSMGLGPVPFVILPEVIPPQYASLGSSFGLGINWVSNIIVAASFPPLRTALGAYDGHTGGLVFLVFGAANLLFAFWMARDYRFERGHSIV
ncbi:hypothetical protein MOBT1_000876 [Malassezia obtusa]|uniref:Major facilitator superfamily (MFS) profile domain-containing protein n=1 Tax=Malassezia obtusa TaxID=76774 RepID=A0AAF0IR28_9BASI|nr:hypothetical protein MOBT1_000876 [Malassezia obtusa]